MRSLEPAHLQSDVVTEQMSLRAEQMNREKEGEFFCGSFWIHTSTRMINSNTTALDFSIGKSFEFLLHKGNTLSPRSSRSFGYVAFDASEVQRVLLRGNTKAINVNL